MLLDYQMRNSILCLTNFQQYEFQSKNYVNYSFYKLEFFTEHFTIPYDFP